MTVMTCSRVTPAFTVRMTITPVVAGEVACAWATDGWAKEVAPIRARASARAALRIAFNGLASPITASTFVLGDVLDVANVGARRGRCSRLQAGCRAASRERLSAIMLMGYEAELHSQTG